jgi:hypothetical protein
MLRVWPAIIYALTCSGCIRVCPPVKSDSAVAVVRSEANPSLSCVLTKPSDRSRRVKVRIINETDANLLVLDNIVCFWAVSSLDHGGHEIQWSASALPYFPPPAPPLFALLRPRQHEKVLNAVERTIELDADRPSPSEVKSERIDVTCDVVIFDQLRNESRNVHLSWTGVIEGGELREQTRAR